MRTRRLILILACATLSSGAADAGQFDPPDPRVFARAEDQERARLLTKPCTEADVGHGCYRYAGHALREYPCAYHIDAGTIGSIPTDQCYKMEPPRRYRGIWVDEFEGQAFIPEGSTPPEWPRADPKSAGWRQQFERARAATIWLDMSRVYVDGEHRPRGRKWIIEFVGRKTMYPGEYGHMGLSGHEIIVDRVLSLKPCSGADVCG